MERTIYEIADRLGFKDAQATLLAGDASTRKYYRLAHSSGSVIVMKGEPFGDDDPNVHAMNAYRDMGIKVPSVEAVYPEEGIIVQQDIGDIHLQMVSDRSELEKYYKEAVSTLVCFQKKALEQGREGRAPYPTKTSFTHEKFLSELSMTTDFYIRGLMGRTLSGAVPAFYSELVERMMEQPFLLQHRDYHSRNLMVHDGGLFVIDIQDSRLGPFTYDVASLVIDPYIDLDDAMYDQIIRTYYEGIKGIVDCSYERYLEYYYLCFLQRGIKILGTFAFQKIQKGKANYLPYIPVTVDKIRKVAVRFPRWKGIILGEII